MSLDKAGEATSSLKRWVPKVIVAASPQDTVSEPAAATEPTEQPATEVVPEVPAALSAPPPEPEPELPEPDPQLLDQARAEGYALGLADGSRQAQQRAAAEAQQLRELLAALAQLRGDLESSLAQEVLSLAVSMARQIVRQAIELRPEAILPALRDALQVLPALHQNTVLHLHPEDAALVRPLLDQDPVLAQTTWRIVEDAKLERGGCRLETPESEVDATVSVRWSNVLAALGREDSWHPRS